MFIKKEATTINQKSSDLLVFLVAVAAHLKSHKFALEAIKLILLEQCDMLNHISERMFLIARFIYLKKVNLILLLE